jgi:hypothetical protein
MRKLLICLSTSLLSVSVFAGWGHNDYEDHRPFYPPMYGPVYSPVTPPVAQPRNGVDGRDGKDSTVPGPTGPQGVAGISGQNGRDGQNAPTDLQHTGRLSIRLLDLKHLSIGLYDTYNLGAGHNQELGVDVMFKLGESYESRQLKALEKRLAILEQSR